MLKWFMKVEIRLLKASDRDAWLALLQGYLDFYKTILTPAQTDLTWKRFFDPDFNSFALVAEGEGEVIGLTHYSFQTSTWSDGGYCYLEDLFVNSAHRSGGTGAALIDRVKEIALAANCSRLYWNTDATNSTARILYDKYGKVSGKVQYRIHLNEN